MKSIYSVLLLICINTTSGFSQARVIHRDMYTHTQSAKAQEYYNKAAESTKQKDYAKAIGYLKQALAEDPEFIDAYDNLGFSYRQLNNLDSAERYYLISHKKYPKGTVALINLGVVEQKRKNYTKGVEYYNQLLEINPKDPEGYFGLAKMYYPLNNIPEALKNANLAEKYYKETNAPYISDCYYIQCIIYITMNDKEMGRKYMALAEQAGMTIDPLIRDSLK